MAKDIKTSEITDESVYNRRRDFLKKAGIAAGSVFATGMAYRWLNPTTFTPPEAKKIETVESTIVAPKDELTDYKDIISYNNYYEFSTGKRTVAPLAQALQTSPWTVVVDGLVSKPTKFGIEDLLKIDQEERVYRFRCVEGWSMVIPWVGFPLAKLLKKVEPKSSAKYVAFQTFYPGKNPEGARLPNGDNGMQSSLLAGIDFPYVEGLRMDEAMNDLTLLATGIYGKTIPNQNGAPVRLVVPWKYGFKSIKSLVRISLLDKMPPTSWSKSAPNEYGFFSNVNPKVSHPRWSQADEQRIGEIGRRATLMFNGYGKEVASMYKGMDLRKNY